MHTQEGAQAKATSSWIFLWRHAPVWRWSLIGAAVCTGLLIFVQQVPDAEISRHDATPQQNEVVVASSVDLPSLGTGTPVVTKNAAHAPSTDIARAPVGWREPEKQSGTVAAPTKISQPQLRTTNTSNQAAGSRKDEAPPTSKSQALTHVVSSLPTDEPPHANTCDTQTLDPPPLRHGILKVVGFMPQPEALELLEQTQKQVGMKISPRYVDNQRVRLLPIAGKSERYTVALLPKGMQVKMGDIVDFTWGVKSDPKFPCNYVPNLIDHVVGAIAPIAPLEVSSQVAK